MARLATRETPFTLFDVLECEAELALRELGSRRKYPWAQLLDGAVHVLERGRDFDDPQTLRVAAVSAAARRSLRVRVRVLGAARVALVAFRPEGVATS